MHIQGCFFHWPPPPPPPPEKNKSALDNSPPPLLNLKLSQGQLFIKSMDIYKSPVKLTDAILH